MQRQVWVINPALSASSAAVTVPSWAVMIPQLVICWGQIFPSRCVGGAGTASFASFRSWGRFPEEFTPSSSQTPALGLPWPRLCTVLGSLLSNSCPRGFARLGMRTPNRVSGCWESSVAFPGTNPACPGAGTHLELTAGVEQQEEAGRARRGHP